MIDFKTTVRVESKILAGVTFVIRAMAEGARNRVRLETAEAQRKISELTADAARIMLEFPEIDDARQRRLDEIVGREGATLDAAMLMPRVAARVCREFGIEVGLIQRLGETFDRIGAVERSEVYPAYVHNGLVAVEGATIDGCADLAAENVLENFPSELVAELASAIQAQMMASPEELKNLSSPSTGSGAEPQAGKSTSAAGAEGEDGTGSEIAAASTRPSSSPGQRSAGRRSTAPASAASIAPRPSG